MKEFKAISLDKYASIISKNEDKNYNELHLENMIKKIKVLSKKNIHLPHKSLIK